MLWKKEYGYWQLSLSLRNKCVCEIFYCVLLIMIWIQHNLILTYYSINSEFPFHLVTFSYVHQSLVAKHVLLWWFYRIDQCWNFAVDVSPTLLWLSDIYDKLQHSLKKNKKIVDMSVDYCCFANTIVVL